MTKPKKEAVNSPPHYTKGGIECIDAIRASMSDEQFKGYLKGNVMKYLWRFEHKGKAVEDLLKSEWYLSRLMDAQLKEEKPAVEETLFSGGVYNEYQGAFGRYITDPRTGTQYVTHYSTCPPSPFLWPEQTPKSE